MDIYICGERYNVLSITGSISNKAERDYGVNIQTTETHDSKQSINYEARDTILLWTDSVGKSEKKKLKQKLNDVFWAVLCSPDKKEKPEKIIGGDSEQDSLHDVFCFMFCVT